MYSKKQYSNLIKSTYYIINSHTSIHLFRCSPRKVPKCDLMFWQTRMWQDAHKFNQQNGRSNREIFECTYLNFTVSGRSKQTSIDCAQCSHASVTSLQDYCRNDYLYLELLMYVCSTIICSGLDRNMCQLCNKIIGV